MASPRLEKISSPASRQPTKTNGESNFAVPLGVAGALGAVTVAGMKIKLPGQLARYLSTRGTYVPSMSPSVVRTPREFARHFFKYPNAETLKAHLHLGDQEGNFIFRLPSVALRNTGGMQEGLSRAMFEKLYMKVVVAGKEVENYASSR
jgi:hypothetical protein